MRGGFVKPKARSCIVVGAGLAGLSAAYRLIKRGWEVTVVEALQRVGGRVFSYRFIQAPHLVCELGGEWIGAKHSAMLRLCDEFGLKRDPHRYAFSFWNGRKRSRMFLPGAWSFSPKTRRNFGRFKKSFLAYDTAQLKELDQYDWWTMLRSMGFTTEELMRRDLMDSTDFGESNRLSSAYSAAAEYVEGNNTDAMDFKIRKGNDQLTHALAGQIPVGSLYMGTKVRAIRQHATGVEVYVTSRRRPLRADFCICTVPAHCLLKIKWSPELPPEQAAAAQQLQYSRIMKTAVLFNKRFWSNYRRYGFSAFTTRVSDFCFDSTYRQPGLGGILCSYAIGDKADNLAWEASKANVKKWIREDMLQLTGAKDPDSVVAVTAKLWPWQKVAWIGGAYAFYRPGQWFTVRPALQRPHGRVLFAGEHLAELQGFMEGAVNTGEAAADQL